ncbi:hypothetical protein C8J45_104158 [Sphingomonas sp. PP-CE-3G-477]|uniref:DUF6894 family protein n=1 Tax=Sphingomonas sp. PP-CE-3G-477 TaxID=2135660 RepID=UPI000D3D02DE|nr:hypothetical protein [Sphingomonas sp. PP-CE-3G-477]PTQ63913.1 hypothetical protein C8J45_104158 [Sphingomonas sp. PP-CE-3G-477]
MPRYFFDTDNHTHDGDNEGTDLADDDEARVQAIIFAGDYLRDHPGIVSAGNRFSVSVRDARDTILLTVVVTVEDPREPGE